MTTLYVAGPMRGRPLFNFPAFDHAATDLRNRGYMVFSPADFDRGLGFDVYAPDAEAEVTEAFMHRAVRRDLEAILRSDGIALLDGWETSQGCQLERTVATALGIEVEPVSYWRTNTDVFVLPDSPGTLDLSQARTVTHNFENAPWGGPPDDLGPRGPRP